LIIQRASVLQDDQEIGQKTRRTLFLVDAALTVAGFMASPLSNNLDASRRVVFQEFFCLIQGPEQPLTPSRNCRKASVVTSNHSISGRFVRPKLLISMICFF
jgi:hypothetical protein